MVPLPVMPHALAGAGLVTAYLGALVMEALKEALQQLIRIVNPLGVLAHNPDHGSPGLGLIQGVQVLAQGGDDALIPGDQHTVSSEH